jgi:hypothetical protein
MIYLFRHVVWSVRRGVARQHLTDPHSLKRLGIIQHHEKLF